MDAKKRLYILLWFFILSLGVILSLYNEGQAGWGGPKIIRTLDAGLTVDATIVKKHTKIYTTKRTLTVKGSTPIFIGKPCAIMIYDNNKSFLCVEGEPFCWEILREN